MKIVSQRMAILDACKLAASVTPTRTTIPAWQSLLITAGSDGAGTVSGTDGERFLTVPLRPHKAEVGEVLINASVLVPVLSASPEGLVTIRHDEGASTAEIETPTGKFYASVSDVATFARLDTLPENCVRYTSSVGDLFSALKWTIPAVAVDEGKYSLQSVLFDLRPEKSTLVASDGKRLAVANVAAKGDIEITGLIPAKAANAILSVLAGCDDSSAVELSVTAGLMHAVCEEIEFTTRLVEGRFPPWRDIIPKKSPHSCEIVPEEWLSAVRQASCATDDESQRVVIEFDGKHATFSAQSATKGKCSVHIDCPIEGIKKICFDPSFLTPMLKAGGDSLTMSLTDEGKPGVWKREGRLHLIVPLV